MKKTILLSIATFAFAITSRSQINIENSYVGNLQVSNLTSGGYKYYNIDLVSNQVKVYNTNHSIYKTINLPTPTGSDVYKDVILLSDNLFDTDNLIEFILLYKNSLSPVLFLGKVINENGTVILQNNRTSFQVFNISGSFKLKCKSINGDSTIIYSLSGSLPCDACGGPTSIVKNNSTTTNTLPNAYPNPTSTQITIPYTLTNSDTKGKINIYDINGKILREYNVDNTFEILILDTQEFSAGTYYYNLTSNSGVSDAKKIIVIK